MGTGTGCKGEGNKVPGLEGRDVCAGPGAGARGYLDHSGAQPDNAPFDLLINNKIRAEVKTAINVNKKWYFALTQKQSLGISDNNANYIKLNNGRYRKDFTKTCDVIILCGIAGSRIELFIMPPNAIPKNQTTISSSIKRGKWWMWHNRFDVITSQLKQA